MNKETLKALAELQSATTSATTVVNKFDLESELVTIKVASGKYTTISLELNKALYRDMKAGNAFDTKPELLVEVFNKLLGIDFELVVKTAGSQAPATGEALSALLGAK